MHLNIAISYIPALFIGILLNYQICSGQNLVANPSFEVHTQCPNNYNQVSYASGWFKSLNNNNPSYHSEYLNACGTSNFSVPSNTWGYQAASNGVAYMATVTTAPSVQANYRENIYTTLTSPLQVGATYSISFKISHTDNSQFSSDKFGVKLTKQPNFPIDNISQVYSTTIVTNNNTWTTISGTFVADSAYTYIGIGNFFNDANTNTTNSCSSCSYNLYGYFVDEIDVHQISAVAVNSDFSCNDTTICLFDTINFQNLSTGAQNYLWNFGDLQTSSQVNPKHVYQNPGIYHVVLQSSNGSTSATSDLYVTVLAQPILRVMGGDTICAGGNTNLSVSGASSYSWSPSFGLSNSNSSTITAAPTSSTLYTVTGVLNGCVAKKTIIVTVLPNLSPYLSMAYSSDSCKNEIKLTNLTPLSRNCVWNFGDNTFGNSCNAFHIYSEAGNYTISLTFIDTNGCNLDSSFQLKVPGISSNYLVPNVFTPNGDGINDSFRIETNNLCFPMQLSIYNRWGLLIYNQTLPNSWDGKYKNTLCNEGVYYYVLKGDNFNESGSFTLLR